MASFQYTRNFSDEDVAPDKPKEYTKKERFENWCDYYLKWVIIGVVVIGLTAYSLINHYFFTPKADINVAVVTVDYFPDEVRQSLTDLLTPFTPDVDGDGTNMITVSDYFVQFDFSEQAVAESEAAATAPADTTPEDITANTNQALDPYMIMAGQTQLAGDASSAMSNIWILQDPVGFQTYSEMLCYFDGTMPAEGEEIAWENMVYKVSDCPALAEFAELYGDYYIARRGYDDRQETIDSYNNNQPIWDAITAGATPIAEYPQ